MYGLSKVWWTAQGAEGWRDLTQFRRVVSSDKTGTLSREDVEREVSADRSPVVW